MAATLLSAGAAVLAVYGLCFCLPSGVRRVDSSLPAVVTTLSRFGRYLLHLAGEQSHLGKGQLTKLIMTAGESGRVSARDLLAIKSSTAVIGLLPALAIMWLGSVRVGALLTAALPVAGFYAPDLWLGRRARQRQRLSRLDLPDFLDLLRVAVEAGLPLQSALTLTAQKFSGPLADECLRAASEQRLGLSQHLALEGLANRISIAEVSDFVELVQRSRRYGLPLGEALGRQARNARHARSLEIKEQAAKAGPKIQLIIAVVLVPAALLLFAAALLARLLSGSGGSTIFG